MTKYAKHLLLLFLIVLTSLNAYAQHEGDYSAAISKYTKAIENNPESADAFYGRATAYYANNDLESALADYTKAIELSPKYVYAYVNRGRIYAEKKKWDLAISEFNASLEISHMKADIYTYRGLAYFYSENFEKAFEDFNQAIKIDSNYSLAYYGLAFLELLPNSPYKDYDKSWINVHKAESLGYKIPKEFIEELEKASNRKK